MKIRKTMTGVLGLAVLLTGVSAAALTEATAEYHLGSDKIDIRLEEFRKTEHGEAEWKDGVTVLPGMELSKIPRITNQGAACYIRARVTFAGEKDSDRPLTADDLKGIGKEWCRNGSYYYYTKVLQPMEQVDFFQGIQIPADWKSGKDDDTSWQADVQVDAVQAESFSPDFGREDPWGMGNGVYEIQKAQEGDAVHLKKDETPIHLEIAQDMEGFSVDASGLFRTLETFVPGKSQTGTILLKNRGKKEREVFAAVSAEEKNAFLEKMDLTIQYNTKGKTEILYQGSAEAGKTFSLGRIPAGMEKQLEVFFHLPEDADNRYAAREGKVRLTFTTDRPAREIPGTAERISAVRTGDPMLQWIFWGLLADSGGILLVAGSMMWKKKGKRK